MIAEFFIQLFTNIVSSFQSIFPLETPGATDTSAKIYGAVDWVFGNLHKSDTFLPTDTLINAIIVVLGIQVAFMLFDLSVFIFKRIRG